MLNLTLQRLLVHLGYDIYCLTRGVKAQGRRLSCAFSMSVQIFTVTVILAYLSCNPYTVTISIRSDIAVYSLRFCSILKAIRAFEHSRTPIHEAFRQGMAMADRSKITDQLVEIFVRNINTGNWKVGEKIPSENELTRTLGASRASVRGAIQYLVALGVLESQHGRGTFLLESSVDLEVFSQGRITPTDCDNIAAVLEFRLAVESECAYLAARNTSKELINQLEKELRLMKDNINKQAPFVMHDMRFHMIIAKASGNALLSKSLVTVFSETRENHEQMNTLFGFEDGIYYHTLILNAIKAGDSKSAYRSMQEHMTHAIERIQQTKQPL